MATQSYYERVGSALTAVRDGIQPELERIWAAAYGDDWIAEVNRLDRFPDQDPSADDLSFLLKGIWNTWQAIFRHQFSHAERNYVSELREARNRWAHNERFGYDDTYRVLDTAERLLTSFNAAEYVEAVRTSKQELMLQKLDRDARNEQRQVVAMATKGEPQAGLSSWRDIVTPHPDVAEGRFELAEFAADLYQVSNGRAEDEYQDPQALFGRTYITRGLGALLKNAAKRLSGSGGDPVVELETSFGGGKTHSLIALYHMFSGVPVSQLPGVEEFLAEDGLSIPSDINRAVFVGQMVSPATPSIKSDGTEVRTIWGELAWQLGGAEGYAIVAADDAAGTSPGPGFVEVLERYGPTLILIDEWVAYARMLPRSDDGTILPAGDFGNQFTFAQTLATAARAVGNTLVVVSLPQSSIEVGGDKGQEALTELKNVILRDGVGWTPAEGDESFEIVRRRLFQPIPPDQVSKRDAVIRAYQNLYLDHPQDFPSGAKEADYRRRLEASYPLHPELFDRLYKDWSTLDRFQLTRGMLRLMATVVSELWKRDDKSLMIMPGTVPMDAREVSSELVKYLDEQWPPIIATDVDGPVSLPLQIDQQRPNLGRYSATRRVARTTFVGSAPRQGDRRGVDLNRIILGCVQPGEQPGPFQDALRHLSSDATYLYSQGAQYWYDTKPTLSRLAADRAESNFADVDADIEVERRIKSARVAEPFGAVHVFPGGPGDVLDDDASVRLVILPPDATHKASASTSAAIVAATEILEQRQGGPRIHRNMLAFVAPDQNRVQELRAAARSWLAWKSILEEKNADGLNLSPAEVRQVETKLAEADESIQQRIGEAFPFVLTPRQEPGSADVSWRSTRATGASSLAERAARRLESSEDLITSYSGIRVRMDMDRQEAPLWEGDRLGVKELWNYYTQYLYMPRLAGFGVLAAAVSDGVAQVNWENDTFAYADAFSDSDDRFLGLRAGENVPVGQSHTAVVVRSDTAMRQFEVEARSDDDGDDGDDGEDVNPPGDPDTGFPTRFYARKSLDTVRAIRDFGDLVNEVASHLGTADASTVVITVEIAATSEGFDERTRRTVSENARQLGFEAHEFED